MNSALEGKFPNVVAEIRLTELQRNQSLKDGTGLTPITISKPDEDIMPRIQNALDLAREISAHDPEKSFEIESQYISENPDDSRGYFARHLSLEEMGRYVEALQDCSIAIRMQPKLLRFIARSEIHRALGDYPAALADLNQAHDMDREEWLHSFGPHLRADTLARLGRLDEAIADAALLPDDHWMPAHSGLPGGDKTQFIAELHSRAARAPRR